MVIVPSFQLHRTYTKNQQMSPYNGKPQGLSSSLRLDGKKPEIYRGVHCINNRLLLSLNSSSKSLVLHQSLKIWSKMDMLEQTTSPVSCGDKVTDEGHLLCMLQSGNGVHAMTLRSKFNLSNCAELLTQKANPPLQRVDLYGTKYVFTL